MSTCPDKPPAQPFFLQSGEGRLFCMYYPPASPNVCPGAVLYVAPFAEEMNKSRRMAALQARALAAKGYAVLQIDLFGTGDSEGSFGQTHWERWKYDLGLAASWLQNRVAAPISVWALRLGALLAIDFIQESTLNIRNLLLWHPVLDGRNYLTQFLRLRIASDMLAKETKEAISVDSLRRKLISGKSVEVAGYELAPDLAHAIDNAKVANSLSNVQSIHWFEIVTQASLQLPPGRSKFIQAITSASGQPTLHLVTGDQFWSSPEPIDCPELVIRTLAAMDDI